MANAVYPKALKKILDGDIDFLSDTIKVVLLDGDAVYDSADEFYSDVSGDAVAMSSALTSKTTTGGVFDAADPTFTALTGSTCEAWVAIKDTGTASTSPLIAWFDTKADTTAYSYTPNGSDHTLQLGAGGVLTI